MSPRKINLTAPGRADLNPGSRWRRELKLWWSNLRTSVKRNWRNRPIDRLEAAMTKAAIAKDWKAAAELAGHWAARAQATGDKALLLRVGYDLRRLRSYQKSFELIARSDILSGPTEWDGSDLTGKVILLERRKGDLTTFFIYLSIAGMMVPQCRKCIILVEGRIAPLYRRTFPDVDVRIEHRDEAGARSEADFVTSFEMMAHRMNWNAEQSTFLRADEALVEQFRLTYKKQHSCPVIGIAWGSINQQKNVPAVDDWANVVASFEGRFVSLQYGNTAAALEAFERSVPGRILVDPTVDQLVDMDRFAAQVASLDAVITIKNTAAHVAGALGVRTIVLPDDRFAASWPGFGRSVPWYQNTILLEKHGKNWRSTLEAATEEIGIIQEAVAPSMLR